MMQHQIVSPEAWREARLALLDKEKAFTKARDALRAERAALPWKKVETRYVFQGPDGPQTLADLFAGRSQLFLKHFMLAPGQTDPCVGCSFESDHIEAALVHLTHHDVSVVMVSRAPIAEIEAVKARMGWTLPWFSSQGSDFNTDFEVSFTAAQHAAGEVTYNYRPEPYAMADLSGLSAFYRDEAGDVFHTYSTFGRGGEDVISSYMILDMMPKGRNETGPRHNLTDWVKLHDRYDEGGHVDANGRYHAPEPAACCSR